MRFLILFVIFSASLTGKGQGGANISGAITGALPGKVRLICAYGNETMLIDSAWIEEGGKLDFRREKPLPGGLYYFVLPDNSFFNFILADDQEFSFTTSKSGLSDSMKTSGSADNELYYYSLKWEAAWQAKLDPIQKEIGNAATTAVRKAALEKVKDILISERENYIEGFRKYPDSFFAKFKLMGQNPKLTFPKKPDGTLDTLRQTAAYKKAWWAGYDFTDDRLVRTPLFANKLKTWILNLTPQNYDSLIAATDKLMGMIPAGSEHYKYAANQIALWYSAKAVSKNKGEKRALIMGSERVYVHVIETYFTPEKAFWDTPANIEFIRREARYMTASMLDKKGQDLAYVNALGKAESLYAIPAKAKIVFLYSTSCEHCQEQAPKLSEVHKRWKEKGLEVFAVCIDPGVEAWRNFIASKGMDDFHNFIDDQFMGGNVLKYYVDITPEIYVLNAEHKIVAKDLHPDQLDEVLAKILN